MKLFSYTIENTDFYFETRAKNKRHSFELLKKAHKSMFDDYKSADFETYFANHKAQRNILSNLKSKRV